MTTEELFKKYKNYTALPEGYYEYLVDDEDFKEALIEFAKYHVQRALKEKVIAMSNLDNEDGSLSVPELGSCTENAYPLENIK